MKNKGFTLIELLAVILILGFIALIAIPIVNKIIKESKDSAFKTTVINITNQIHNKCVLEKTKSKEITEYYQIINKKIYPNIDIKGDLADGIIYVDKDCNPYFVLKNEDNTAIKDYNSEDIIIRNDTYIGNLPPNISIGTPVYFNPETALLCNKNEVNENVNNKTGCMKWYVYKKNDDNTHQLILSHNTTDLTKWNESGKNSDGMTTILTSLENDTQSWKTSLNPDLITANDIAKIIKNDSFNESTSVYTDNFKFNPEATEPGTNKYAWLFDYTIHSRSKGGNVDYSGTRGYWTKSKTYNSTDRVWNVNGNGLYARACNDGEVIGIRPVITY